MNPQALLRAVRPVYVLVTRASQPTASDQRFWSMKLDGLHQTHLKDASNALREQRKRSRQADAEVASLKLHNLHRGLADALGSKSFDAWRNGEQSLIDFLRSNGMTQPADLIQWSRAPARLTARQLSDRLFNSRLPLPRKIFTGVGSRLFPGAPEVGRFDLHWHSEDSRGEEERIDWCERHADQIVMSFERRADSGEREIVELNGRDLLLHGVRLDRLGCAFNLLGDNLIAPMQRASEFTLYNASEDELALDRRVFDIFREEIEGSEAGWLEVFPLPGNANIIFLKGANGAFDWVIRDQRDRPFTGNPFHPVLLSRELPTAMKVSEANAHLYFKRKEWHERLEHNAESRHYAEGGNAETWPGYQKLLLRELIATRHNFVRPSQPKGWNTGGFTRHQLDGYALMVSPLVTIRDFRRFLEASAWRETRMTRARGTPFALERDLAAVNLHDEDHLPASVTFFDAMAFCRDFEDRTGLPARLLEVDEWKQISPPAARDVQANGWADLTWAVRGGDDLPGAETEHRWPEACSGGGFLRFEGALPWVQNAQGLPFLSVVDFGEWLADFAHGHAPVANAATGCALITGSLDRERCPAHLTMRYKGLKVGFRICYVAHLDA